MPTYDYRCERCGPFQAFRAIAQRDTALCPGCGSSSARAGVSTPYASMTNAGNAGSGSYARFRHAGGCGCCPTRRSGR
jgi:putative FmdB family regulatory protein